MRKKFQKKSIIKSRRTSIYLHSDKANSPINFIYKLARKYALSSKKKIINSIVKDKKGRIFRLRLWGTGGYYLGNDETEWLENIWNRTK